MKTTLVTFNPWLYNELGHSLIYTQHVEKASKLNGWSFLALLPKKSLVPDLPKHWKKEINCPTVRHWFEAIEKRPYRRPPKRIRAKQRALYYYSTLKQLLSIFSENKNTQKIFFLEAFAQTDLVILANLLKFLPKKNVSVWIVHRYPANTLGSDVARFERCHKKFIEMGVSLKLLTDSDLLQSDLTKTFKVPVYVLPIHYIKFEQVKFKKPKNKVICWWPGLIREGKGLSIIQDFVCSESQYNEQIQLVINENAELKPHDASPQVIYVDNHLSREDYLGWMNKSHVILLPYLDKHYQKSTSSIFLEAIMAGTIPLVYPNTWMAHELEKYELDRLVLDWNPSSLSEKVICISRDDEILEKLRKMCHAYYKFHSLENYATTLLDVEKS